MRSIVPLCALAILLSGCAEWKTKPAANQDPEDDAKCQSSGGKPDDPAYVQCPRSSMRHARKRRRRPTNSRESVHGHQHFRRVLESTTDSGRRIRRELIGLYLRGPDGQPIDLTHRRTQSTTSAETAKMLTKDEARRIAVNIAKLPEFVRQYTS